MCNLGGFVLKRIRIGIVINRKSAFKVKRGSSKAARLPDSLSPHIAVLTVGILRSEVGLPLPLILNALQRYEESSTLANKIDVHKQFIDEIKMVKDF